MFLKAISEVTKWQLISMKDGSRISNNNREIMAPGSATATEVVSRLPVGTSSIVNTRSIDHV